MGGGGRALTLALKGLRAGNRDRSSSSCISTAVARQNGLWSVNASIAAWLLVERLIHFVFKGPGSSSPFLIHFHNHRKRKALPTPLACVCFGFPSLRALCLGIGIMVFLHHHQLCSTALPHQSVRLAKVHYSPQEACGNDFGNTFAPWER